MSDKSTAASSENRKSSKTKTERSLKSNQQHNPSVCQELKSRNIVHLTLENMTVGPNYGPISNKDVNFQLDEEDY